MSESRNDFVLWSGVFDSFAAATQDQAVFEEQIWLDKSSDRARRASDEHARNETLSQNVATHEYVLPAVAASIACADATLRILDFGGGMASTFFAVVDALPVGQPLAYSIVESKPLCRRARELELGDERLSFHDEFPALQDGVEIVHAGSSVQYVEDWRGLLRRFCSYRPSHIVLADVPAGDLPRSFVTGQYFYGKRIAHWFFRIDEFVSAVEQHGYRLTYRAPYIGSYLGERRPLPMDGLPVTHQLRNFCQLMFRRV
jgi:putative methyltransferase (TIGR04325 family)